MTRGKIRSRSVVVIGGTGTIGSAVCQSLVKNGVHTIATFHRTHSCQKVDGVGIDYYQCDLLRPREVNDLLNFTITHSQGIQGLVVCLPGCFPGKTAMEMSCLQAHISVVEAFAPYLMAHGGGEIVMLSSTAARLPFNIENARFYAGTKGYIESYVRASSGEFAPHVRINALALGIIQQNRVVPGGVHAKVKAESIPLKRFVHPEEIARLIRFLLLENTMMTGQTFPIDGGLTASLNID
jgi:NAD(P)-dependent dehydrogenase (short-subunit alcohol dehydrogenase family)